MASTSGTKETHDEPSSSSSSTSSSVKDLIEHVFSWIRNLQICLFWVMLYLKLLRTCSGLEVVGLWLLL
ncbi:hypothetical protein MKW98_022942 [Papaver atlanticum]|uniref:Uncharacterized protein n=1 Tax=Papaver atlanticum TaxID=357466 RepID=A0AAD4XWS8_9MAGN|nr:hypothetical protein MKW98_022942 [Papaver atlanticum]